MMDLNETADEVVTTLRKIIRAIDIQSKKLTKTYGLTGPQLIVLKEIRKDPTRPISIISREVSLSQATVTTILNRLEQQGFAKRQRSEQDKRKVNLLLTDKAEAILNERPSLLQEEFSGKFAKIEDWEKHMILASLERLASMMNAENIDAQPVLFSGPIAASSQDVNNYLEDDKS